MSTDKKTNKKTLLLGVAFTLAMIVVLIVKPEWFWTLLPFSIGSFVVGFNGI